MHLLRLVPPPAAAVAFVVLAVGANAAYAALALQPALRFVVPPAPARIEFPDAYKQSKASLWQARRDMLDLPGKLEALDAEDTARRTAIEAEKLPPSARDKKLRELKQEIATRRKVLELRKEELINGFLYLVEDFLTADSDPYVLLIGARVYYDTRTKAPEEAVEAGEDAVEGAPPPKRETFNSAQERVLAMLAQIREKHAAFRDMDEVLYLEAVVLTDLQRQKRARDVLTDLLRRFPTSVRAREARFRLGELQFAVADELDHYDRASETYRKVVDASDADAPDTTYWRALYKLGWSNYSSMAFKEEAFPVFEDLYSRLRDRTDLAPEQVSMREELKKILLQHQRGRRGVYQFQ